MLKNIVLINNLCKVYDNQIVKGVKDKQKINLFEENKILYLSLMKKQIIDKTYDGGVYHIFLIFEPKIRLIMAQNIFDKTINHFITEFILKPRLEYFLLECNCATRKNMGTSYAIKLFKKNIEANKKYDDFYFLKLDIKKYFYTIDHEILKNLIKKHLDEDEFWLLEKIIDSTNKPYINHIIDKYNQKGFDIPYYETGKGLPIGNMTSQFLAIYYLNNLQHFIIHNLHLKYLVVYMDDFLIIHHDKKYLEKCLKIIKNKLINEYKLELNSNKTHIKSSLEGVSFLGYNFKVVNKKTIIKINNKVKRKLNKKIKKNKNALLNKTIDFKYYFSSMMTMKNSYRFASKKEIINIFEKNDF